MRDRDLDEFRQRCVAAAGGRGIYVRSPGTAALVELLRRHVECQRIHLRGSCYDRLDPRRVEALLDRILRAHARGVLQRRAVVGGHAKLDQAGDQQGSDREYQRELDGGIAPTACDEGIDGPDRRPDDSLEEISLHVRDPRPISYSTRLIFCMKAMLTP